MGWWLNNDAKMNIHKHFQQESPLINFNYHHLNLVSIIDNVLLSFPVSLFYFLKWWFPLKPFPMEDIADSKVHGANMGSIWGQQDPDGPHVGPMNFTSWDVPTFCSITL